MISEGCKVLGTVSLTELTSKLVMYYMLNNCNKSLLYVKTKTSTIFIKNYPKHRHSYMVMHGKLRPFYLGKLDVTQEYKVLVYSLVKRK